MEIVFRIVVDIPQLNNWKGNLMDALDPIRVAVQSLKDALAAELVQIADKLANTVNLADAQAVADDILSVADKVKNIIPDQPQP